MNGVHARMWLSWKKKTKFVLRENRKEKKILFASMAKKHFGFQQRINELEDLNVKLLSDNDELKLKIADLGFEIALLQEVCNDSQSEIAVLKATIVEKDAILVDKEAELENLLFTFNAATTRVDPDALLDTFNVSEPNSPVTEENSNEKMGEDLGDESIAARAKRRRSTNPERDLFLYAEVEDDGDDDFVEKPFAKKRTGRPRGGGSAYYHPKRQLSDGTFTQRTPGARPYNSRRIPVTDPRVLAALTEIYNERGTLDRNPGIGHEINGVRYAQYFGRLNRAGTIGRLWTIILSSEGKVYQLNNNEKHIEIKWQNDRANKKLAYGTINLLGEGENYQCSILPVFKSELGLFFDLDRFY